ncbi:MAG: response regulator [Candidatus Eisenbacteria bacterium]
MPRVMVVDDDGQVREVWRAILEEAGYDVVEAEDGVRAMDVQRRTPADLVITDLLMPVKDGLETIMHLQRTSPSVKVIAVTGGGKILRPDLLRQAKLLGAVRNFQKPLDAEKLLDAVRELAGPPDAKAAGSSSVTPSQA